MLPKIDLKRRICNVINHNTEYIRKLYSDYNIVVIPVNRMISSSLKEELEWKK